MHIRDFHEADHSALLDIMYEVVLRGDAFVYDDVFSHEQLQRYLAGYEMVQVAEADSQIVGGYVIRANQAGRGSHVANATYLVSSAVRGQGIGRKLGEHSLRKARQLGFSAMQFNAVVSTNLAAVALWKQLGFAVVGTIPCGFRHITQGEVDLLVMFRTLSDVSD